MIRQCSLPLLAMTLLASSTASAGDTDLAILGVKPGHGVEPTLAKLLDEALSVTLRSDGAFSKVLGSSDVASLLDLEQQKAALGCGDESCMADLGGALGVPYGGVANIGKLGKRYLITLKIIDIEAVLVVASAMVQGDDEGELVDNLEELVAKTTKAFAAHRKKEAERIADVEEAARAKAAAEARAKDGEAKRQAAAEARARHRAEAHAKAEAEKKAKAEAEAKAQVAAMAAAAAPTVTKEPAEGSGLVVNSGIIVGGLAASGFGAWMLVEGQNRYDKLSDAGTIGGDDMEDLEDAYYAGNSFLWGGVAVAGFGAWRMLQ